MERAPQNIVKTDGAEATLDSQSPCSTLKNGSENPIIALGVMAGLSVVPI